MGHKFNMATDHNIFAIRDDEGTYKGVIEVSQDVTHIRGLEGQQRLLDWE